MEKKIIENSFVSTTKGGDIIISLCNNSSLYGNIFNKNISPKLWSSCHDAYEFTWNKDIKNELTELNNEEKMKLINSMGFCPHLRCQLNNISNAGSSGFCPSGLCYTKVEHGSPSFGACCFNNGTFNSGQIIGYYYKIQPIPKPIYKKSRIVLGDKIGGNDESIESFINANKLYKGIIATQCPLTSYPEFFDNTVNDAKIMILEQNITKWIQLSPYLDSKDIDPVIIGKIPLGLRNSVRGSCGK
jgi:hypothetical protein